MRRFLLIFIFLLSSAVDAQDDTKPVITGGLGWSSDGRFIAVGTTAGVHIHASDNLQKLLVLDESFYVTNIAWSNTDLRIAYADLDGESLYIYNAATGQRSELQPGARIQDIAWSTTDKFIAAFVGDVGAIVKWRVETGVEQTRISLRPFTTIGHALFEWSPDEQFLPSVGSITDSQSSTLIQESFSTSFGRMNGPTRFGGVPVATSLPPKARI